MILFGKVCFKSGSLKAASFAYAFNFFGASHRSILPRLPTRDRRVPTTQKRGGGISLISKMGWMYAGWYWVPLCSCRRLESAGEQILRLSVLSLAHQFKYALQYKCNRLAMPMPQTASEVHADCCRGTCMGCSSIG